MGEHLIARPIGPSYVPATSKGQSSANAPVSQMTVPQQINQPAATPNPLLPGPAQQAPNPAQGPRNKFQDAVQQVTKPTSNIRVVGQGTAPSAIGTGLRRYQTGGREV